MYNHIMISVRINAGMVKRGIALGFPRVFRTKAQQAALTRLYAEKAGTEKAFRLDRTDTAGNRQADGGNLIFGQDGQDNVHILAIKEDFERCGYCLTVAEIFQKEEDKNGAGFFRLVFTHEDVKNGPPLFEVDEKQEAFISLHLNRLYRKLYGFRNEASVSLEGDRNPIQGSIVTLNIAGPVVDEAELKERRDLCRDLRLLDENGHFRCSLRNPTPAPTEKVA